MHHFYGTSSMQNSCNPYLHSNPVNQATNIPILQVENWGQQREYFAQGHCLILYPKFPLLH